MGYATGFLREEDHFSEKAVYGRTGRDYPADPQQPDREERRDPAVVEEKVFEEKLQSAREKDLRFRVTSVGPHRDDFCVQTNGIDIRKYGSQGQQRTAALSLKMSEIYLVEKVTKDHPVLLLDDVLSELDSSRQNYLLQSIHNIQTVITCTGLDELIENNFSIDRVFRVTEGKIDF